MNRSSVSLALGKMWCMKLAYVRADSGFRAPLCYWKRVAISSQTSTGLHTFRFQREKFSMHFQKSAAFCNVRDSCQCDDDSVDGSCLGRTLFRFSFKPLLVKSAS